MAKLKINGHSVTVDDSFLKLSPDDQNATVDEIAKSLPQQHDEGTAQKVARSVLMGIPFSDRAMAGMQTAHDYLAGNGKDYAGNLADVRAANEQLAAEHPVGAFIGSMVGGAALPMGALAKAATVPANLGARSLLMGGSGAAMGGVYGVSDAPDLTNAPDVASHALRGAGTVGVLGSVIPPLGAAIGKGVGAALTRRAPGADGMSRGATDLLAEELFSSGPETVRANKAALGPDAMLVDTTPGFLGLGQGTAVAGSAGTKAMATPLLDRSAGSQGRILTTADAALGKAIPPRVAEKGIEKARLKRDAVNYGEALRPNATVDGPPPIDTSNVVRFVNNNLPRAEGEEKTFLERFGKNLFKPNPDLVEREAEQRFKMPSERVLGARDYAIQVLGGMHDPKNDFEGLTGVYKGLKKPGGLTPDQLREALAEQGYLDHEFGSPDVAMAESTPNHLYDILDSNRVREADRGLQAEIDAAKGQKARLKERAATEGETPDVVPKTEAENLHKIKYYTGKLLEGQPAFGFQPGSFTPADATVSKAYKLLNTELERQVPGYERANRVSEQFHKRENAVGLGGKALGSGPSAPWPQELEASIAPMSKKERSALKIGARGVIGERLGHQINDLKAGESVLKGEHDFNRANAEMIFGKDNVDALAKRLEAERKFKNTENAVIGNSQSVQRAAALSRYKPVKVDFPPHSKSGVMAHTVAALLNKVLPDKTKYAGEVGSILTKQGAESDAAIEALVRWLSDQKARQARGSRMGLNASRKTLAPLLPQVGSGGPSSQQEQ